MGPKSDKFFAQRVAVSKTAFTYESGFVGFENESWRKKEQTFAYESGLGWVPKVINSFCDESRCQNYFHL